MAEDSDSGNRTKYVAGIAVLAVIAAAGFLVMQGQVELPTGPDPGDDQQPEDNESDSFDQYASADEESGSTDTAGATVGETVEIDEFGVTPARAVIEVGEAVSWRNELDAPVRLEFDRTSQTPTIESGGTLEMRFRAVTYYEVYNAETDEQITGGSIATE